MADDAFPFWVEQGTDPDVDGVANMALMLQVLKEVVGACAVVLSSLAPRFRVAQSQL